MDGRCTLQAYMIKMRSIGGFPNHIRWEKWDGDGPWLLHFHPSTFYYPCAYPTPTHLPCPPTDYSPTLPYSRTLRSLTYVTRIFRAISPISKANIIWHRQKANGNAFIYCSFFFLLWRTCKNGNFHPVMSFANWLFWYVPWSIYCVYPCERKDNVVLFVAWKCCVWLAVSAFYFRCFLTKFCI